MSVCNKSTAIKIPLPPGEPTRQEAIRNGQQEPHWAIAILLDWRFDLVSFVENELVSGVDYPDESDPERALGMFDKETPGWVPYWFPSYMHLREWQEDEDVIHLTDQQRVDWFAAALEHYSRNAGCEWPPKGLLSQMIKPIALSLLYMQAEADQEAIPGIDRLDTKVSWTVLKSPTDCHLWKLDKLTLDDLMGCFEEVETYECESHLERRLLRCKRCGQLYFYEFNEWVDWEGGDDSQYWTYIPVSTPEEILKLRNTDIWTIGLYEPCIRDNRPKGAHEHQVCWVRRWANCRSEDEESDAKTAEI